MTVMNNIILNHNEINHKIRRIAFQIYESNVNETEVVLAGIDTNGYILAKKLKIVLQKISDINAILCKVTIDKKNPHSLDYSSIYYSSVPQFANPLIA